MTAGMTVEDARMHYRWHAFRLKNEAQWRGVSCRTRADDALWHEMALGAEAFSLAYDLAVAASMRGEQRLHTCRACSGGGRVANPGSPNASRRVVCSACHGVGALAAVPGVAW